MTVLYGIPNCDTVKKARAWLAEQGVAHTFCDFKKSPPDEALLRGWLAQLGAEVLINRRGTTWRKLSPEQQVQAQNEAGAVALMAQQPSIIKRPVLVHAGQVYCGFAAEQYAALFGK